jgi:hypothetical protein
MTIKRIFNPNSAGPGQVDPANFDVKFRTNFLYVRFLKIDLFLQKRLANLFELLT